MPPSRRRQRQGDGEDGAALGAGRHGDGAALGLDDPPADRQADAHAIRLGADEGLEEPVQHVAREAHAGILHLDLQPAAVGILPDRGGDRQLLPLAALHRLDRVAQQVHQHLLHRDPVDPHRGQVRRQVQPEPQAGRLQGAKAEAHALLDHRTTGSGTGALSRRVTKSRSRRMISPARKVCSAAARTASCSTGRRSGEVPPSSSRSAARR